MAIAPDSHHLVLEADALAVDEAPAAVESLDATEIGMLHDVLYYLPDDILTKLDRASMSVSLETRVPFLDPEIFSFAWSLRSSDRVRGRQGKWLLRQVLARHVPPEIVTGPKRGFGVPLAEWLRGPLSSWADALLDPSVLRTDGYFDENVVRQTWNDHRQRHVDRSSELWPVLVFQSWLHDRV